MTADNASLVKRRNWLSIMLGRHTPGHTGHTAPAPAKVYYLINPSAEVLAAAREAARRSGAAVVIAVPK